MIVKDASNAIQNDSEMSINEQHEENNNQRI